MQHNVTGCYKLSYKLEYLLNLDIVHMDIASVDNKSVPNLTETLLVVQGP